MLISPINCTIPHSVQKKTISMPQAINFQASKHLQPINPSSFKNDSTRILYTKIKKYLQLLGSIGKIKDIPLSKSGDIFLSINKDIDKTNIRVTTNNCKNFIDANFNKDGQMTIGDIGNFHFERSNKNKRIIQTPYGDYTPHGYDDRKWGLTDDGSIEYVSKDDPLLEIFLEFARLYTSIFK